MSDRVQDGLSPSHRGQALGYLHPGPTRWSASGVDRRADEPSNGIGGMRPLDEALPDDFLDACDVVVADLCRAVGSWHRALKGAQGMIVNHAANDALLLLDEVTTGSGRSAARTARALFEHLLHYCEVTQPNPAGADATARYEDHVHVTADQVGRRAIGLNRLAGKAKRKEKQRLERLVRHHKGALGQALSARGRNFVRGWSSRSLFDIAKAHGYANDYDSYRILSAVTHGSAGGLLGTRREMSTDGVCHRLGPDLQLVPAAFHEGLTWWRDLVARLPPALDLDGCPLPMKDHIEQLLDCYSSLLEVTRRLDGKLWPANPAPNFAVPFLAVFPNGKHAWFELDTRDDLVRRADLVGPEPKDVASLVREGQRANAENGASHADRPWAAPVLEAQVRVRDGMKAIPSSQLLRSPTGVAEAQAQGAHVAAAARARDAQRS